MSDTHKPQNNHGGTASALAAGSAGTFNQAITLTMNQAIIALKETVPDVDGATVNKTLKAMGFHLISFPSKHFQQNV